MRKSKGFVLADENSSAYIIGDESFQIKSKFPRVHVAVDTDRVNGIQKLINADQNIDMIILDDAFQHRYVKAGLSLLLIDYNRPLSGDALLPFGRLREPPSAIKRADIIIITKSPGNLKASEQDNIASSLKSSFQGSIFFTTVSRSEVTAVYPGYNSQGLEELFELRPAVLMLSGIANPENLRKYVDEISSDVKELVYPDHHFFSEKDVSRIIDIFNTIESKNKIILTSEKDAARLRGINSFPDEIRKKFFFIPIKISFLNHEEEKFNKLILEYVRKNKRNRLIHNGKNRD